MTVAMRAQLCPPDPSPDGGDPGWALLCGGLGMEEPREAISPRPGLGFREGAFDPDLSIMEGCLELAEGWRL